MLIAIYNIGIPKLQKGFFVVNSYISFPSLALYLYIFKSSNLLMKHKNKESKQLKNSPDFSYIRFN